MNRAGDVAPGVGAPPLDGGAFLHLFPLRSEMST